MDDAKMWFLVGFKPFFGTQRADMVWPIYDTLSEVCEAVERVNMLRSERGWQRIIARPATDDEVVFSGSYHSERSARITTGSPQTWPASRIGIRFWEMSVSPCSSFAHRSKPVVGE